MRHTVLGRYIRSAQVRAALAVNRELVLLYWSIGWDILDRQQAVGWGGKDHRPPGIGPRRRVSGRRRFQYSKSKVHRVFAEAWPDKEFVQQLIAELPG